jgi:hypothetical protein
MTPKSILTRREFLQRGVIAAAVFAAALVVMCASRAADAPAEVKEGCYVSPAEISYGRMTFQFTKQSVTLWSVVDCPVGEPKYPISGTYSVVGNVVKFVFPNVERHAIMNAAPSTLTFERIHETINGISVLFTPHGHDTWKSKGIDAVDARDIVIFSGATAMPQPMAILSRKRNDRKSE